MKKQRLCYKIALLFLISINADASRLERFIVKVTNTQGGGTGFYLKTLKHTYIITNEHVCESDSYKTIIPLRAKAYKAKVLFKNKNIDLCAIEAKGDGFSLAEQSPECGESLVTGGYPALERLTFSVNQHCDRVFLGKVIGGQSGSPVLNLDLEVVGVMEASFSQHPAGYFIPLSQLTKFLEGK